MTSSKSTAIYDSTQRTLPAIDELRGAWQYRSLIAQLVRRDITTRYKRSVLGVAWTMLNPLGTTLILAIVFSRAFGSGPEYAAYVLSGLIAWNFFSQTVNASMLHLIWGEGLLKRIYLPRTVFALSASGTGLVNVFLSLVPLVLIMLFTGVPIRWTILFLPVPILFMALFALGFGLLISTIAVYFADVAEMYQVGIVAWMYLSPIIYHEEILPESYRFWITRLNPMYHLIKTFRAPIYDGVLPSIEQTLIAASIGLITFAIGWLVFTSKADEFAYRI
ncbi:MAG: ABC transporter permease [Anaerolineales bacterium]